MSKEDRFNLPSLKSLRWVAVAAAVALVVIILINSANIVASAIAIFLIGYVIFWFAKHRSAFKEWNESERPLVDWLRDRRKSKAAEESKVPALNTLPNDGKEVKNHLRDNLDSQGYQLPMTDKEKSTWENLVASFESDESSEPKKKNKKKRSDN